MVDSLPLAELEFRIALLPAISRGAHLAGPTLHARRLVELWKVDDNDDVPLAQAFRLLDAETVARAILRTSATRDYPSDPCHWIFPPLADLLPELQECAWQAMLDGALLVEAIKGVRGTRLRVVLPTELPRLAPDWRLSRLVRDGCDEEIGGEGRDEFIDVHVRRPPVERVKKAWRDKPSQKDVDAAVKYLVQSSPGSLSEEEIWQDVKVLVPSLTRKQVRAAIDLVESSSGNLPEEKIRQVIELLMPEVTREQVRAAIKKHKLTRPPGRPKKNSPT